MIQMTDAIVGRMRGEEARLLHFVHYTIAADLARSHGRQRAQEVKVDVDVERLFASIDLLVDRYNQPWSPFIATWHPGLESFSPQPSLSQHNLFIELNNFERALKDAQSPQSRYSGFSSLRGALVELLERLPKARGRATSARFWRKSAIRCCALYLSFSGSMIAPRLSTCRRLSNSAAGRAPHDCDPELRPFD